MTKIDPVKLTQDLVRFNTVTPNDDGICDFVKKTLEEIGFSVEVVEFKEEGTYPVKNIYAKLGSGKNALALCGHLDVVPVGNSELWSEPPFSGNIKDGVLISRGSVDMKSGCACLVSSITEIIKDFDSSKNSLVFLFTLDEESLAINGVKKLIRYSKVDKKDELIGCLLAEPTSINSVGDTIKIGRRGSVNFHIIIKGKQGHVAYPQNANNPVYKLKSLLKDLLDINLDSGNENFEKSNLEVIHVSTDSSKYNVIPEIAEIKGNIRFNNIHTLHSLTELLNKTISKYEGTSLEILADASESFLCSKDNKLFSAMQKAIKEVTAVTSNADTRGGTSDARFIKEYCDVIEFGLLEKTLHEIDERTKVKDIELLHNIYVKFIKEFFNN